MRELADELQREPLELVLLDQLVQVNGQQFESDASVVPKRERIEHVDDVHRIIFVLFTEVLQYTDLLLCLAVETLLVAYHFKRDILPLLVVISLHHLPETTLTDNFEHLVSVRYVVVRDVDV